MKRKLTEFECPYQSVSIYLICVLNFNPRAYRPIAETVVSQAATARPRIRVVKVMSPPLPRPATIEAATACSAADERITTAPHTRTLASLPSPPTTASLPSAAASIAPRAQPAPATPHAAASPAAPSPHPPHRPAVRPAAAAVPAAAGEDSAGSRSPVVYWKPPHRHSSSVLFWSELAAGA